MQGQQAKPEDPAEAAYRDWTGQHPSANDDAGRKARDESLLAAAAEWTRQWPDSTFAWEQRREALLGLRSHSASDWKETGEALLRLWPSPERDLLVAADWIAAGVLLEPGLDLLRSKLARHKANALVIAPSIRGTLSEVVEQAGYNVEPLYPLQLLTSAAIQLKRWDEAKAALAEFRHFVENEFPKSIDPDPVDTIPDYVARVWTLSGDVALAEGRKLDALGFYGRVISDPYVQRAYPGGHVKQARALWNELGGSEEAWTAWSKPSPLPAELAKIPPYVPMSPWRSVHYALPPVGPGNLKSADAKPVSWSGKTTFVAVWASWCGPCWNELPGIQRLADQLKNRTDFQVITLSADEDPEKLARFMRDKGYTFPVIVNPAYVKKILPDVTLGQRWIVDATGAVRLWTIGWGMRGQEQAFADIAIHKLERVANFPSATPAGGVF